jgi:hypothetical protein
MFDDADTMFEQAEMFNERGDGLQLVMLISALGLAFAAWASLLKEESAVRLVFSVFSIGMLVYSIFLFTNVPTVIV